MCCTVFDSIVPSFVLPMSVAAVDGLVTPEPDSGQCDPNCDVQVALDSGSCARNKFQLAILPVLTSKVKCD